MGVRALKIRKGIQLTLKQGYVRNLNVFDKQGLLTVSVVSGAHILSRDCIRRVLGTTKLNFFYYYSDIYVEKDKVFWTRAS